MTKILKVINPFHGMNVGDEFVLSDDKKEYVWNYEQQYDNSDDTNSLKSRFTSSFSISTSYANELVKKGYLEEVKKSPNESLNRLFCEIDELLKQYNDDLINIDEDCVTYPECLKVEKQTVLRNLINLLDHLKSLNSDNTNSGYVNK